MRFYKAYKINVVMALCFLMNFSCVSKNFSNNKIEFEWYKGTVDSAFLKSKRENKPVFLYWGAKWCPPCNEIKSEVFSKRKFKELASESIPVYLDGDTDAAQIWGQRLKVSGYPTLLLLSSEREELMRFGGNVTLEEFTQAFAAALTLNTPFTKIIDEALSGNATPDEWYLLAYFSWHQNQNLGMTAEKLLNVAYSLANLVPDTFKLEKALLSAKALEMAAMQRQNPKLDKNIFKEILANGESFLRNIFHSKETKIACRSTIISRGPGLLSMIFENNEDGFKKWQKNWLEAAKLIQNEKGMSVDTRLWTIYPFINFYKSSQKENPGKKKLILSKELSKRIKNRVTIADKEAKSKYERHSVISGAAYLLDLAGFTQDAKNLLNKELKQTDTPWYYQSSLSSVELRQNNIEKAVSWSKKARASAKGNATRLQWSSRHLFTLAKLQGKVKKEEILEAADNFYKILFELSDGFSGRNLSRVKKVEKRFFPLIKKWKMDSWLQTKNNCKKIKNPQLISCKKHFEAFLKTKP